MFLRGGGTIINHRNDDKRHRNTADALTHGSVRLGPKIGLLNPGIILLGASPVMIPGGVPQGDPPMKTCIFFLLKPC